ncbi:hypothetical protein G6011_08541 [Alternaria panax]|uniref:Uncharacterized protein n=1 Tax=Alternaria panax TaxID=48097 RepID=A0AAD4I8Q0_9PLEO|nr:hypothetical protein G6011_08541 [Alternaria panax]
MSGDINAHVDALTSTKGLGDLNKLPRELRDMIYESMLAQTLDQNVDVEDYLSRPNRDLPSILKISRTIREEIVLVALHKRNLIVQDHRTMRQFTSSLERFSANKGFASVQTLELRAFNNIRCTFSMLSLHATQVKRFPALRHLGFSFDAHTLVAIDPTTSAPSPAFLADLVQNDIFKELFACTTLRCLTLEARDCVYGLYLTFGASKALQYLGSWLEEEFEKRKMEVKVQIVETYTPRYGPRREMSVWGGRGK